MTAPTTPGPPVLALDQAGEIRRVERLRIAIWLRRAGCGCPELAARDEWVAVAVWPADDPRAKLPITQTENHVRTCPVFLAARLEAE